MLFVLGTVQGLSQQDGGVTLDHFVGSWKLDLEKSYSRSERRTVSSYSLEVTLTDLELRLYWDYTISGRRSHFSEIMIVDGKEHKLERMNAWDAWSYKASFKKNEIKRSLSYRLTGQSAGTHLDSQVFTLTPDKKYLTVESIFRSARPHDYHNTETKKLVFIKVE